MWWAHLVDSGFLIVVLKVAQHVNTSLLLYLRFMLNITFFFVFNDVSTELA